MFLSFERLSLFVRSDKVFANQGTVFLLDEAVVILFVGASVAKSEVLLFATDFGGAVNKFRAVIVVKLLYGRSEDCFRPDKASKVHLWAVLRREGNPAGRDVRGG